MTTATLWQPGRDALARLDAIPHRGLVLALALLLVVWWLLEPLIWFSGDVFELRVGEPHFGHAYLRGAWVEVPDLGRVYASVDDVARACIDVTLAPAWHTQVCARQPWQPDPSRVELPGVVVAWP